MLGSRSGYSHDASTLSTLRAIACGTDFGRAPTEPPLSPRPYQAGGDKVSARHHSTPFQLQGRRRLVLCSQALDRSEITCAPAFISRQARIATGQIAP